MSAFMRGHKSSSRTGKTGRRRAYLRRCRTARCCCTPGSRWTGAESSQSNRRSRTRGRSRCGCWGKEGDAVTGSFPRSSLSDFLFGFRGVPRLLETTSNAPGHLRGRLVLGIRLGAPVHARLVPGLSPGPPCHVSNCRPAKARPHLHKRKPASRLVPPQEASACGKLYSADFLLFWGHARRSSGFTPGTVLCSGIILPAAWGTTWGARDGTSAGYPRGKLPYPCITALLSATVLGPLPAVPGGILPAQCHCG